MPRSGRPNAPHAGKPASPPEIDAAQFREWAMQAPVGMYRADAEGRCLFVNPRWCEMTGLTPAQAAGKGWLEALHPDDRDRVEGAWSEIVREGGEWSEVYRFRTPAGKVTWVHGTAVLLHDAEGRPTGFLGTNMDITEIRRAHEERDRQYAELETVYSTAPVGLCLLDRDLRYLRINDLLATMNGRSASDHIGRTLGEMAPAIAQSQEPCIRQVLLTGKPVLDVEIRAATGGDMDLRRAWVVSYHPVPSAEGVVDGVGVVLREITGQERAEAARRESESKFRILFQSMLEGVAIHEIVPGPDGEAADYRILDVNPSFARQTGLQASDVVGRLGSEVYGVSPAPYLDVYAKVAATGEPKSFSTYFVPMARHFRISAISPRKGMFATVFLDVTAQRRAEEEVRLLNQTLEQRVTQRTSELAAANREMESFAYAVSHDLRAPLRGIDGWSAALLDEYGALLDSNGRAYLDRVRAQAQQMAHLIEALLQMSRLTRTAMKVETVDLTHLARSIVATLQQAFPERTVRLEIAPGLTARGDPMLLRVVLENLLQNAWKFTSRTEDACIEFGADVVDGRTTFFVRDNGAGFDMAYADKLFVPFQRLHRIDEYPGTGIGLATVQRIILRHGGQVRAEGEVGRGAVFRFTLP